MNKKPGESINNNSQQKENKKKTDSYKDKLNNKLSLKRNKGNYKRSKKGKIKK